MGRPSCLKRSIYHLPGFLSFLSTKNTTVSYVPDCIPPTRLEENPPFLAQHSSRLLSGSTSTLSLPYLQSLLFLDHCGSPVPCTQTLYHPHLVKECFCTCTDCGIPKFPLPVTDHSTLVPFTIDPCIWHSLLWKQRERHQSPSCQCFLLRHTSLTHGMRGFQMTWGTQMDKNRTDQ